MALETCAVSEWKDVKKGDRKRTMLAVFMFISEGNNAKGGRESIGRR